MEGMEDIMEDHDWMVKTKKSKKNVVLQGRTILDS